MGKKKRKKKKLQKKLPRKKVRIKYKNIFLFLIFLSLFLYIVYLLLQIRIQNIYIKGNVYLTEEEIIKIANLQDYPSVIHTFAPSIQRKLEKSPKIRKVKVSHIYIFTLKIEIEENSPLYFDSTKEKTILIDGKEVKERYDVPVLLNYIPDQKYQTYLTKMKKIKKNTLEKIAEIKYNPNDKDDERFLLSMRDGNYVYLTLSTFDKINHYLEIMTKINKKFNDQRGILYLDAGDYFEVMQ